MWVRCNPNPGHKEVPDCVIRSLAIALNSKWIKIYDDLCALGRKEYNMPSADSVWGKYLYQMGFEPFLLPENCPSCITIKRFCIMYPHGTYIIGTGGHAVAVIDGDYYDSWDSGDEIPSFFLADPIGGSAFFLRKGIREWLKITICGKSVCLLKKLKGIFPLFRTLSKIFGLT